MSIKILYNITIEDIQKTEVYNESYGVIRQIITSKHYIKSLNGWLTVCHYKGLDHVLRIEHIKEHTSKLIKLFYDESIPKQYLNETVSQKQYSRK